MGKINVNQMAISAVILGVMLLAVGLAYGQDHDQTVPAQSTTHEETDHAVDEHAVAENTGEHADAHGGDIPHLTNIVMVVLGWLDPILPEGWTAQIAEYVDPIFSLTIALLVVLFMMSVVGKLSVRRPGRTQMAVELIFGGLYDLFQSIIGPSAREYTPYLGTLFIFIFCNNLAGMLPFGHAATSKANTTTEALAIMTFLYVQGIALRKNGIGGYLWHMAGSPKSGLEWGMVVLFFPLHLIGEIIKPVSLAMRLFGNIFGEETLVATMVILGYLLVKAIAGIFVDSSWVGMDYLPGIPLQFPFYFLGLISSTIQALVFTLLSTLYIALWLPHDHNEEAPGH